MIPAAEWEATPFFAEFGLRIEQAGEGVARLRVLRDRVQLRGVRDSINGGVIATLAEAAMRVCVDAMLTDGERLESTRELSVAYLSAARGDVTHIEARIVRKGRRMAVGTVEVRDAANGTVNAIAQVACAIEPGG